MRTVNGVSILFEINRIADDPQFELFEFCLPPALELSDPCPIVFVVGNIDNDADKIIAVRDTTLSPMSFYLLSFVTRGSESIHHFENRVGHPLARHLSSVVKPERE